MDIGERQRNTESQVVICIATFRNCKHMLTTVSFLLFVECELPRNNL